MAPGPPGMGKTEEFTILVNRLVMLILVIRIPMGVADGTEILGHSPHPTTAHSDTV